MWADIVKTYWPIVVVLVSLASLVVQTLLAKTYAKRESVAALEGRIAETSNSLVVRITMVEQKIADLPSERELHKLQLDISDLRGELRAVRPELAQLRRLSDLLLENEIKEKA